jgi:murein L,D-transpeptidase YcbB/YkuD
MNTAPFHKEYDMSYNMMTILSRKTLIALICLLLVGGFAAVAFTYAQSTSVDAAGISCPRTVAFGSGDREVVKLLQSKLNEHGYSLKKDGLFGPKTKAAVIAYQKKNHLAVDGIAGRRTWTSLGACFGPGGKPAP